MSNNSPIHPGKVAWTGENPGIYLKETQDGPWTGLMCFFRIFYSDYGMGNGIVVLAQPGVVQGYPAVAEFLHQRQRAAGAVPDRRILLEVRLIPCLARYTGRHPSADDRMPAGGQHAVDLFGNRS